MATSSISNPFSQDLTFFFPDLTSPAFAAEEGAELAVGAGVFWDNEALGVVAVAEGAAAGFLSEGVAAGFLSEGVAAGFLIGGSCSLSLAAGRLAPT